MDSQFRARGLENTIAPASSKFFRQKISIFLFFRVKLCLRYPEDPHTSLIDEKEKLICLARVPTRSMSPKPVPLWISSRWRLLLTLMYLTHIKSYYTSKLPESTHIKSPKRLAFRAFYMSISDNNFELSHFPCRVRGIQ